MRKTKKTYTPFVTLEQVCAFRFAKPETYTPSPLMNAVMEAIHELTPATAQTVGEHLGVSHVKLSHAIEVLTGYSFSELREQWVRRDIDRLRREHPDWGEEQVAHYYGFADRSGLWRVFHRDHRKAEYREVLRRRRRIEQEMLMRRWNKLTSAQDHPGERKENDNQ